MIVKGIVKPYPQYEQYTKKDGATDYKQTMLVETYGQYPKLVAMTVMGSEKITDILQKWVPGSAVDVHVNAESREYNGKYYTNLNVWKVESGSQTVQGVANGVQGGYPAQAAPMNSPQNAPAQSAQNGFPMPTVPQSPFNQPMNGGQPQMQNPTLQAQVDHAQQNYQVQPVWNGNGYVHPHTGQPMQNTGMPMNPPQPAFIPNQQPIHNQQPVQAHPQAASIQIPSSPQQMPPVPMAGQPMDSQAWNTADIPF